MNILRRAGYFVLLVALAYAAWLMLMLTLPYTALRPGIDFLKTKTNIYYFAPWRWSFYIHVFTGFAALIAGFTQFSGYVVRKAPGLHRWMGYVYLIDVLLITGPAALFMSFYANGGIAARTSFVLQSSAWLIFTAIAWQRVMKKRFITHGEWMLRSYALALGAISLRTYAALLSYMAVDMRPVDRYILIAWSSWIPNLIVAEILIRGGFIKGLLKRRISSDTITTASEKLLLAVKQ